MTHQRPDEPDLYDVNMDAVVAHVRELGYHANVEQTGGGTATIYAGEPVDSWYDNEDFKRHPACAGPGVYGWGRRDSVASSEEFAVGPDGDGDFLYIRDAGQADERQIAALLVKQIERSTKAIREGRMPTAITADDLA